MSAIGAKQLKLAVSWLSAAAKLAGYPAAAGVIDLAVKSGDIAESARPSQDNAVVQALNRVRADLEAGTRQALAAEFGLDWERRRDLAATIEALPHVLDLYTPDTDEIFAANLDPVRIGELVADAADAAHEELFLKSTVGESMLRSVVTQAYAAVQRNKDFALSLVLRGQQETLDRIDRIGENTTVLVESQRRLERLMMDAAGSGSPAVRAMAEIRDLLRAGNPEIDEVAAENLPDLVKRIIQDLQKPAAKAEDFTGAVKRALTEAQARAADLAFAEAAHILDVALAQAEAEDRDRARSRAALLAERGRIARLQLRYREAAVFYTQAAEAVSFDAAEAWRHTLEAASAFHAQGEEFGDNEALSDAIRLYQSASGLVPRERVPLDWAMTQNNLGAALSTLGEREAGTARLEEAVTAYRDALKEYTRERVPLDWATTQNNLGAALSTLGEREAGMVRLEEAVTAYRDALKERTRERVPLNWATTQNNLGNALLRLGEREAGTARLEEAVTAYRDALNERTRERVPLDWATTQNNLGAALRALGEREAGTARLEEAVTAYRDALKEYTRERVPLDWAMTQNNLGAALLRLGEREAGTARLEEAVTAYRDALNERTRERVPLDWATTQNNLGNALLRLGEREAGTARLEEAVTAYRDALKEYTRERVPLDWAMTQNNLGNALSTLGEREAGMVRLEEAVAAYDAALAVFVSASSNHYAQVCRANRERVVTMLAQRKS